MQLALLLALLHLAAAAVVMLLSFDLVWRLVLLLLIIWSGGYSVRRYAWLSSAKSIIGFSLLPSGQWQLMLNSGQSFAGQLGGDSSIGKWLKILKISNKNNRLPRFVLVLPDSVSVSHSRQLCAYLKHISI